jgi:hypothetical protein
MEQEGRQTLTVRHTLEGSRKGVLHTASDFLSTPVAKPDQPDHGHGEAHIYADKVPPLWSGKEREPDQAPDHEPDQKAAGQVPKRDWSGNGQEPKQVPDQQNPHAYAENSGNGQIGQVLEAKRERNRGEGVHSRSGPSPAKPPEGAAWEDMV